MNRDAYLTGSTSLQHLRYKLHSRRAVQSLSVAGLCVQTASIIRTIGQSAAYQTLLLMIMKDGALCLAFFFQAPCRILFNLQTLLSQRICPDQTTLFLEYKMIPFPAPYNYDYHQ